MGEWLDVNSFCSNSVKRHLIDFSLLVPSKFQEAWQLVWHGTMWSIWKARNEVVFRGSKVLPRDTFEAIKSLIWNWLKSRTLVLSRYNFGDWEISAKGVVNVVMVCCGVRFCLVVCWSQLCFIGI